MLWYSGFMRMRSRPSWRVVQEEAQDLHLMLFVRDSFALGVAGEGIPGPLAPAVTDLSGQVEEPVRGAAAMAWPDWWRAGVDAHRATGDPQPPGVPIAGPHRLSGLLAGLDGPGFESLSDVPALREAARAAYHPFCEWWSPPWPDGAPVQPDREGRLEYPGVRGQLIDLLHLHRLTVNEVVARIERELGRTAEPFAFHIDILAVTEPRVPAHDEHHAAVSAPLVADETGFRDWLYATLRPIA